jgi:hypothetical protein
MAGPEPSRALFDPDGPNPLTRLLQWKFLPLFALSLNNSSDLW